MKRTVFLLPLFLIAFIALSLFADTHFNPSPFSSREEMENALRTARIVEGKPLGAGRTNPWKLTLNDGKNQFHAVFKKIDFRKTGLTKVATSVEVDFKDSWMFEVAAYEIDKLLGLNMVPVTVERRYKGEKGALQWWVNDAITEGKRKERGMVPPDAEQWKREINKVRIFDSLLYNIDRNLGNLLITSDWRVYMIDHSRCFKNLDTLKPDEELSYFSQSFMNALRELDANELQQRVKNYLSKHEIEAMLKRRDQILQAYDRALKEKGEVAIYP